MQTANIQLSIGGDHGNTVSKFGVTAAEIAVLRAIHGEDAVKEVEPAADVRRNHRDERSRLLDRYGKMRDGKDESPVSQLFPGVASRVFETLDELDLPEEFFKAERRARPVAVEQPETSFSETVPASGDEIDEDDGIGDMPRVFD